MLNIVIRSSLATAIRACYPKSVSWKSAFGGKKLLLGLGNILLILLPIGIYASESSPFGSCMVWPHFMGATNLTIQQRCAIYNPELDSAKVCGLSWDRPNCLP